MVPQAAALLRALCTTFETRRRPVDEAFRALTGFTHPRRIALVQAMVGQTMSVQDLRRRTDIPDPSVLRHLRKMLKRGYVVKTPNGYRVATPKAPLHQTLLALALKA